MVYGVYIDDYLVISNINVDYDNYLQTTWITLMLVVTIDNRGITWSLFGYCRE